MKLSRSEVVDQFAEYLDQSQELKLRMGAGYTEGLFKTALNTFYLNVDVSVDCPNCELSKGRKGCSLFHNSYKCLTNKKRRSEP